MPTAPFVHLSGAKLDWTVLDNLKAAGAAQSFVSNTLNAALRAKLTSAWASAGYADLAQGLQTIPAVDILADKDLSLQAFVRKNVALPADPATKAALHPADGK